MRDLAWSMLRMPWTMGLFMGQQAANLTRTGWPIRATCAGAVEGFERMASATEAQLEDWARQAYRTGNSAQRSAVDAAPAMFDPATFMRMLSTMEPGPLSSAALDYMMPAVAWTDSRLVPALDRDAALQEFNNKLDVIRLVTQGAPSDPATPLAERVSRAYALEPFPTLWIVEGLGNHYADERRESAAPRDVASGFSRTGTLSGLLAGPQAGPLPDASLLMLHAGMGMSFAKAVLDAISTDGSVTAVREGIARFRARCEDSARPGYTGAALESLGLAARTLYPHLVQSIDRQLTDVPAHESLIGFFWHGVGRAIYFDLLNILPSFSSPWRAVDRCRVEPPHQLAQQNAIAGLGWALTLVNMRQPQVMETFLRHHASEMAETSAFSSSVTSSIIMRVDTTPDDPNVTPFIDHEPADPAMRAWWQELIAGPARAGLAHAYPRLRASARLDELFHFPFELA